MGGKEPLVLCQREPRLRRLKTTVVRREPVAASAPARHDANNPPAKAAKKKKKTKKDAPAEEEKAAGQQLYEVELEETVLFPEGGGQPSDRGTVAGLPVEYVFRGERGQAVHLVRGEVPEAGAEVEVELDWARRLDHMQHHSAQHLLSALAVRLHGWPTASWWLAARGECHIEFDTAGATDEQLRALERAANQAIREAAPVRTATGREAAELLAASGGLARGPAAAAEVDDDFRTVSIAGHDVNACCGTHVASTAELQMVRLTSSQAARGRTKVFFLAGGRLAAAFDEMYRSQQALNKLLCAAPADHADIVRRAQLESRAAAKSAKRAWEEVAAADAARLAAEGGAALVLVRDDPRYPLPAVADALGPRLGAGQVAFLATGEPQGGAGQFVLVGDEARVAELGPLVSDALLGRGGGRKGKFQGKAPAMPDKALAAVRALLEQQ